MKDKNHISVDAEKAFYKIQHPFKAKTLSKLGGERAHLHVIGLLYDKRTAQVMLHGEELKAFFLYDQKQDRDVHLLHFYSTQYWKSQP